MNSDRRAFFQTMGAGAAGFTFGAASMASISCSPSSALRESGDGPVLQIGNNIAVTETRSGKVRGYILRDIYYFLGIPYGADTSGVNRFMPPPPPPTVDARVSGHLVGEHGSAEHGKTVCKSIRILPGSLEL